MIKLRKSSTGFTLIELIVVITIISILVVAGLPFMEDLLWEARVAATKNSWAIFRTAIHIESQRRLIHNLGDIPPGLNLNTGVVNGISLFEGDIPPKNFMIDVNTIRNMGLTALPNSCGVLQYTANTLGIGWAWYTATQDVYPSTPGCAEEDPLTWT